MTITDRHSLHRAGTAIAIRPAVAVDDWAVHRLFGALHAFNASLEPRFALANGWRSVLREHLAQARLEDRGLTLLAWHDGVPIGPLMMDGHTDSPLFRHRHWAELLALYMCPEARGGDVADRLVAGGIDWARKRGYTHVQLYVTATNLRAKRFYARVGFRPVQEIRCANTGQPCGQPPDDPASEDAYAHGHHLLSPAHHPTGADAAGHENGGDDPTAGRSSAPAR